MAEARRNKFSYDRNYYEHTGSAPVKETAYDLHDETEYEVDFLEDGSIFEEEYTELDFEGTSPKVRRVRVNPIKSVPGQREVTKEKVKRKYNFSFLTIMMLAVSLVALVGASYRYIETRAEVIQANKRITAAKTELKDIQNINSTLKSQLDVETDRNYIYTFAVSKLKMIYPKENDTVYYEKPEEGYVRQYKEIPAVK
ncbi:MAG: hypothetical protein IKP88_14225 [Lachnospiraceae bacterium]|nr:hypothetical protein [Lachnospiraceae bacterium]